ncbi:MAG: Ig-like domain-containing protein [Gemmatimonadota bacterium]|nr:Ig-like domain-containing protein [Gemmatimonadota bacterium]
MRHALIAALGIAFVACASASPPPGGPEDKVAPRLIRVSPDTNAVNVTERAAQFYFDETINDRGEGAQVLDNYFLVSPSDGAMDLSWHRSRIDVRPHRGFRPNTAYSVTMLPGLSDLRNNLMKTGAKIVFSTGPTIPTQFIEGIAFDWAAGTPVRAYIEAISPDSITYLAQSDTGGRFSVGPLPAGSYLLRGIVDQNNNHVLDRSEAYDTVRVNVPGAARIELLTALRDTLPAHMSVPSVTDSTTLTVNFDRALDPTQTILPTAFRLLASDSSVVPILAAYSPLELKRVDSLRTRALADSTRRADSLAGKPLTPIVAPVEPVALAPGAKAPPPPPPRPSVPSPFSTVVLKLGAPLTPSSEHRLSTPGLRALSGRVAPSERRFTTPKLPPPKAPGDTTRNSPAVRRVPPRPPA